MPHLFTGGMTFSTSKFGGITGANEWTFEGQTESFNGSKSISCLARTSISDTAQRIFFLFILNVVLPSHANAFISLKQPKKIRTQNKCQNYKSQQPHFASIFPWIWKNIHRLSFLHGHTAHGTPGLIYLCFARFPYLFFDVYVFP